MTHSQWHFICSPAVWFLPSGTLSIPAVWFIHSGTLFVFPLYDSFPVALYGPNLTQNIRHTSFFLVLQKVLRETETAVTRLLGREFLLKFRQIPWWIYDGVYISSKAALISWSRTLPKTNIIPGQHQELCLYFKSTN